MKKTLISLLILASASCSSLKADIQSITQQTPPVHPDFAAFGTAGYVRACNGNELTARAFADRIKAETSVIKGTSLFVATIITAFVVRNFAEWFKKFQLKSLRQEKEMLALKLEIAEQLAQLELTTAA